MLNYSFTISYDGSCFSGWQIQPDRRTVQGEIEKCLTQLFDIPVTITGAGRTDAGVHAMAQVANTKLPDRFECEDLRYRMNRMLAADIAIKGISVVADGFSARFSAKSKVYEYRIIFSKEPIARNFTLQLDYKPDIVKLNELAGCILGIHDFSPFAVKKSIPDNPKCEIFGAVWSEREGLFQFSIEGNRFLHQMVRALVGAMIDCERGRFPDKIFAEMIDIGEKLAAFKVAPPHALFMHEVKY
ncbi:tRNA pseudouridine(38-40) synthase TruA [bacterium]|nr:tRNA pseudouridine(38-40) synthase TruA [bacterium]